MTKRILSLLIIIFVFVAIAQFGHKGRSNKIDDNHKFITLVYPVRSRNLWINKNLSQLTDHLAFLRSKKLPATFLLQYDALTDKELVTTIKNKCGKCDFGIFLEVSENLATDANVSYDTSDSDWAKPKKIFLSGYRLLERERLIDTTFRQFYLQFNKFPKTIGVWYLDPYSLNYIANKYKIEGYVSVADQFNTDAQKYWGKPWGYPFYPQTGNTIVPANTEENKINVVELQWAQRDPILGYGPGVVSSQHSFQANDYLGNGLDFSYFSNLLETYLSGKPFSQVTLGLEVGQELSRFLPEHQKQLELIARKQVDGDLKTLTVAEFAEWYQDTFPQLSPITTLTSNGTNWVNAPCYRLGYRDISEKKEIFDLRAYGYIMPSADYLDKDKSLFLQREVPALLATLENGNPATVSGDAKDFQINSFKLGDQQRSFSDCQKSNLFPPLFLYWKAKLIRNRETIAEDLSLFKFSRLNDKSIFGVQLGQDNLLGFWQGRGIGLFRFPYQQLTKFRNLGSKLL